MNLCDSVQSVRFNETPWYSRRVEAGLKLTALVKLLRALTVNGADVDCHYNVT